MLWKDESLHVSMKAARYICANAAVKGSPNLTVGRFSKWVNEDLLPNETLEPGFLTEFIGKLLVSGCTNGI